jgi:hypothetical protein
MIGRDGGFRRWQTPCRLEWKDRDELRAALIVTRVARWGVCRSSCGCFARALRAFPQVPATAERPRTGSGLRAERARERHRIAFPGGRSGPSFPLDSRPAPCIGPRRTDPGSPPGRRLWRSTISQILPRAPLREAPRAMPHGARKQPRGSGQARGKVKTLPDPHRPTPGKEKTLPDPRIRRSSSEKFGGRAGERRAAGKKLSRPPGDQPPRSEKLPRKPAVLRSDSHVPGGAAAPTFSFFGGLPPPGRPAANSDGKRSSRRGSYRSSHRPASLTSK